MKKQLNTSAMENELKQGSVFFQQRTEPVAEPKVPPPLPAPVAASPTPTPPPASPEPDQSINQSMSQSVDPSTKQLTGPIVDRPVAFYLPELIDQKIDEAIKYYQDTYRIKFDRSALVSALLGNPALWTNEALDQLIDQVTEQMTNRLTSRLTGRRNI